MPLQLWFQPLLKRGNYTEVTCPTLISRLQELITGVLSLCGVFATYLVPRRVSGRLHSRAEPRAALWHSSPGQSCPCSVCDVKAHGRDTASGY